MENFYGGRRGAKGDSLAEITLDNYGKLKYKTKSYITADGDGPKLSDYIEAGDIQYVEDFDIDNNGVVTYTYNYYDAGTTTKHTRTDSNWNFPANKVTYGDTNIDAYIKSLDYTAGDLATSKTITAISETDGKIAVTASDISIASSQINDKTSSFTPTDETSVVTGKAVDAALKTLEVPEITDFGKGNTIKSWKEEDGKVSIVAQSIEIKASQISDGGTVFAKAEQGAKAETAVQSVIITNEGSELKNGTTVVLPAYPTTLPASDVISEYNSSSEVPISGKGVAAALSTLTIPSVTDDYSSISSDGMSGIAVASALSNFITIYSSSAWSALEPKPTDQICLIYTTDGEASFYYKPAPKPETNSSTDANTPSENSSETNS